MFQKIRANRALLAILFTIFVDMLGIGILIPVIPLLLADPRSPYYLLPGGYSMQQGFVLLGFLTASYPFMMFLAAPILGQLSDVFGRRRILAFSLFGTFLSYGIFAIGIIMRNIPLLFFSRMVDGITGGNIAVAQAAAADVTTPQNRAKTFGLIGSMFGLGFIIGPYLGGKLSDHTLVSWFSAATPFWFAAMLSGLNVLSVVFFFPETRESIEKILHIRWAQSFHNIFQAFTARGMRGLFTVSFLYTSGFSFMTAFFSVYLIRRFGFSQGNIGDFFAYLGIWIAFTQAVITRKLSARVSESNILRFTMLGTAIAFMLFFVPRVSWQLLLVAPVLAINNGLTYANLLSLISRSADASIQGEIMGINSSLQALGQSIPPILSGMVAAQFNPEMPIVVGATIVFLSWLLFIFVFHNPLRRKVYHEG
ncbi:MAG: MFS transporter [Candidatus Gottesmanbacteria bacterium]|nr:MFS transporter [Candidatus Gottesmanbacteria bacterium]